MSARFKHQQIYRELHRSIEQGEYPSGTKLPSEEALCRRWNVSRPTVARALRDLQTEGLITRRSGSGSIVLEMDNGKATLIGLLVEGLGETEILDPICNEIMRAGQERGCSVFTGRLSQEQDPAAIAESWKANGVKGIFFAPFENIKNRAAFNQKVIRTFEDAGVRVVLIDRDATDFPARSDSDLVAMDNFHAGHMLGSHMASRGCTHLAFIARPSFPNTVNLRLGGVREGFINGGGRQVRFLKGNPDDPALLDQIRYLNYPCDGIVCSNDLIAAHLLKTALDSGWKIPGSVSLASFDNIRVASLVSVPLTTISQNCRKIGDVSIDTLLGRIAQPSLPPRKVLIQGSLVIRKSTGTSSSQPDMAKNSV